MAGPSHDPIDYSASPGVLGKNIRTLDHAGLDAIFGNTLREGPVPIIPLERQDGNAERHHIPTLLEANPNAVQFAFYKASGDGYEVALVNRSALQFILDEQHRQAWYSGVALPRTYATFNDEYSGRANALDHSISYDMLSVAGLNDFAQLGVLVDHEMGHLKDFRRPGLNDLGASIGNGSLGPISDLFGPLFGPASRRNEREATLYGLEAALHYNPDAIEHVLAFFKKDKQTPTHPSAEQIEAAIAERFPTQHAAAKERMLDEHIAEQDAVSAAARLATAAREAPETLFAPGAGMLGMPLHLSYLQQYIAGHGGIVDAAPRGHAGPSVAPQYSPGGGAELPGDIPRR